MQKIKTFQNTEEITIVSELLISIANLRAAVEVLGLEFNSYVSHSYKVILLSNE